MLNVKVTEKGAKDLYNTSEKFRSGFFEIAKVAKEEARLTAKAFLAQSFPAVGNDPLNKQGGTPAALAQGKANIGSDINSMFIPLKKFTVKELVMQRNPLVWHLGNPIPWRDAGLAKAWARQDMDTLFNAFSSIDDKMGDDDTIGRYDYDEGSMHVEQNYKLTQYIESPTIGVQRQMMRHGRWNKQDKIAVRDAAVVRKFIQKRQQDIGKSANGWKQCLTDLGSPAVSSLPAQGKGKATQTINGADVSLSLSNPFGDPNGWVSNLGIIANIVAERTTKLKQRVAEIVERKAKLFKKK